VATSKGINHKPAVEAVAVATGVMKDILLFNLPKSVEK
jgi:hypothetical protein